MKKTLVFLFASLFCLFAVIPRADAEAPPVRINVVAGSGSGQEQDVVDRINGQLQGMPEVALGGANPDWKVVCTIKENLDQAGGQIRYNGTVTVKTVEGRDVTSPISMQKYNQDFSLTPGMSLNKKLVDGAVQDVIVGLSERAVGPIQQAIDVEMETRRRLIKATLLGHQGKYDDALAQLAPISPETPHFDRVRVLMKKLQIARDGARPGAAHPRRAH